MPKDTDTLSEIESRIKKHLAPVQLNIVDESAAHAGHQGAKERPGAGHFQVTVVSALFEGKNLIERHRLVYHALGDLMTARIHALSLKTKTPTELSHPSSDPARTAA